MEYPKYPQGSKSEVFPKDIDKDMEAMEKRMAENESRSKEISRSINQDNLKVDDDSRLPSLEWYGSSPDPNISTLQNQNHLNKDVTSSSPTRSDIELREMLRNPQPPETPTLLDYLTELCSETEDSTIRTLSLNNRDTESESLDTILTRNSVSGTHQNHNMIFSDNNNEACQGGKTITDIQNASHTNFLPIMSSSTKIPCQKPSEEEILKSRNISLSRKLLERNLEKLIQEDRISGQELISQLTNEMTESQVENLRRLTDTELWRNNQGNNIFQHHQVSASSCSYIEKQPSHHPKRNCHTQLYSSDNKARDSFQESEECFRSPAIPRKTIAQNMIQSSYNVSPDAFISRCRNKGARSKNSNNYATIGSVSRPSPPPSHRDFCRGKNDRSRQMRDFQQNVEYLNEQQSRTPLERQISVKLPHRSHSYRQSTRNNRMCSTVTRESKEKYRRSGHFFQWPTPKRNEDIQYYSPQPQRRSKIYLKPPTSKHSIEWKGSKSHNTPSFYTDTYPVSTDYDYCSSCSTSSTSSSSSSDDEDDNIRIPRQAIANGMEKQIIPRNKILHHSGNPLPYYGGVRASYLPNDRKRLLKQKKLEKEYYTRNTKPNDIGMSHKGTAGAPQMYKEAIVQPVIRHRNIGPCSSKIQRPMSDYFLSSEGARSLDNVHGELAETAYKGAPRNVALLLNSDLGKNRKKLTRKEIKNKNCIVS